MSRVPAGISAPATCIATSLQYAPPPWWARKTVPSGPSQGQLSAPAGFDVMGRVAQLGYQLTRKQAAALAAIRYVEDGSGFRDASRQHALAARYLDLFGARIDEHLAPQRWPRIIVLDSKPLNVGAYGAEDHVPGWDPEDRGGAILMAVGTDVLGSRLMPVPIGPAGDETKASWVCWYLLARRSVEPT